MSPLTQLPLTGTVVSLMAGAEMLGADGGANTVVVADVVVLERFETGSVWYTENV